MARTLRNAPDALQPKSPMEKLAGKARQLLLAAGIFAGTLTGCGMPPEGNKAELKKEQLKEPTKPKETVDDTRERCVVTFSATGSSNCDKSDGGVDEPKDEPNKPDEGKVEKDYNPSISKPTLECEKDEDNPDLQYCYAGDTYKGSVNIKDIDPSTLDIFVKGTYGKAGSIRIFDVKVSPDGKSATYQCKVVGMSGSKFVIISTAKGLDGKEVKVVSDETPIY